MALSLRSGRSVDPPKLIKASVFRRILFSFAFVLILACAKLLILVELQTSADADRASTDIASVGTSPTIDTASCIADDPNKPSNITPQPLNATRFVVCMEGGRGQGLGNVMKGITACYYMAQVYNRIACIEWKAFKVAFDPPHQDLCTKMDKTQLGSAPRVLSWNFGASMTLQQRQDAFASDAKVITFEGNTGAPRYALPSVYDNFVVPSSRLKNAIPWTEPPNCVVHLRKGDNGGDRRKGTDEATLKALEDGLDRDCYLITNNMQWYKRFSEGAGWAHPQWSNVKPHQSGSSTELELVSLGAAAKSITDAPSMAPH